MVPKIEGHLPLDEPLPERLALEPVLMPKTPLPETQAPLVVTEIVAQAITKRR